MSDEKAIWKPWSFTKNFSWGPRESGLRQLHNMINIGFDGKLESVQRSVFRNRVRGSNRPDFIAINFFLLNSKTQYGDYILPDELVFQAVTTDHSDRFDLLALFAFNLSLVGTWSGAEAGQNRPAMWANHYIRDHLTKQIPWSGLNKSKVNPDSIQRFISNDPRYVAKTSRKLSTNLAYLYSVGKLHLMSSPRIERWWVDAVFLALDRIVESQEVSKSVASAEEYTKLLMKFDFLSLTGGSSLEKKFALPLLSELYIACGGKDRFSADKIRERQSVLLPDIEGFIANDNRPRGAVHPTNPRIVKSIPGACAMLAKYAGFYPISPDELEGFDISDFVRVRTLAALQELRNRGLQPRMSAEDILRITREK